MKIKHSWSLIRRVRRIVRCGDDTTSGIADSTCHARILTSPLQQFCWIYKLSQNSSYDFMVLVGNTSSNFGLRKGLDALNTLENSFEPGDLIFKLCKACQANAMACIPPSAFSAGRIRESQRDSKLTNVPKTTGDFAPKYFHTKFMELSPLKYNSKLMNSIWGFYNRYSPHNVKKVSEANASAGEMQQSTAISSGTKNEPVLNLPSKLDSVWASIKVSQSH